MICSAHARLTLAGMKTIPVTQISWNAVATSRIDAMFRNRNTSLADAHHRGYRGGGYNALAYNRFPRKSSASFRPRLWF